MQVNEKHYNSFSNLERLNLTLAALARNDEDEMKLLIRTCPIKYYYSADMIYANRLQAIVMIGMRFSELLTFHHNKILLLNAMLVIAEHAPEISDELFESEKDVDNLFDGLLNNIAYLKSVYHALVDFCNEVKISYEYVLKIEKTEEKCDDIERYLSMKIEEDKTYKQRIKSQFYKYWDAYDYNTNGRGLQ